jgi:hypothetical protein
MAGDGFGSIPKKPGVYCLRAQRMGKYNPTKTIARYLESPLFAALQAMGDASEKLFNDSGLGTGWGWKWYANEAKQYMSGLDRIAVSTDGVLPCPILYIGRSSSLWHRVMQLMGIGHVANHPLWALLHSGWPIELAVRVVTDFKEEEHRLKLAYCNGHDGELAPLMKK